ncbi:tRNA (adenosine(37)-N6)-dimethylallyltransferase MiaA [Candidatus Peregrinibacteria bacterium]|nr:tRNA (adenosine(37)-N6)-dimethylallyltransferase MiaA [Candidatus Peregrinibacteria bacterium]
MDIDQIIKDFLEKADKSEKMPLLVILGGTASGKTSLSIDLAKRYQGEIISTDSRQIYKYMDIGTAKIKKNEMHGIAHYMIDIVEPDEQYTLADFVNKATRHIEDIGKRGKLPILVGGTGLYIRAICQNYAITRIPPNNALREKLKQELEEKGEAYLYEKLKKADPHAAKKIHPHNHRYVIRALEIAASGKKKSYDKKESRYEVLKFGIEWDRETLYERINTRAKEQVEEGLINETKMLLQKGYDMSLPSMSSLGYPEMIRYIRKELSLEEALALLQKNTRNYAKRQLTWFRREPDVIWISGKKLATKS